MSIQHFHLPLSVTSVFNAATRRWFRKDHTFSDGLDPFGSGIGLRDVLGHQPDIGRRLFSARASGAAQISAVPRIAVVGRGFSGIMIGHCDDEGGALRSTCPSP